MADSIIDACCLTNLCAAGDLIDWLKHLGGQWHVPKAVMREALFLRVEQADGEVTRERISLEPMVQSELLRACEPEGTAELELYFELAAALDDGEAMALALAKSRGWTLATDDRKAIRQAAELKVRVVTTPELVQRWGKKSSATKVELRDALLRIQRRAGFFPPEQSPLHDWWFDIVESD